MAEKNYEIYNFKNKKLQIDSILALLESVLKSYENSNKIGIKLSIYGLVQGVGFRPFVYNIANALNLKGYVENLGDSVEIMLVFKNHSNIESSKKNTIIFLCCLLDICGVNISKNAIYIKFIKDIINEYIKNKSSILHNIFLPKQAKIDSIRLDSISVFKDIKNVNKFIILESNSKKSNSLDLKLPLDTMICKYCLKDLSDKNSRFYNYPFTTCINCGARYSILNALPYDRENTTMKDFKMCEICKSEYENPQNRRFHTQPISCPKCKISLTSFTISLTFLENNSKNTNIDSIKNIESKSYENSNNLTLKLENLSSDLRAIKLCANALKCGKVVLFKGLGGYAYLANARDSNALKILRDLKARPSKPFAVMGKLKALQKIALLDSKAKKILTSAKAPILLTFKAKNYDLSPEISALNTIGVMIPYTALLTLLFKHLDSNFVMAYTSANKKGDMIATNLGELFDNKITESIITDSKINIANLDSNNLLYKVIKNEIFIVTNNRDISHRLDDSILSMLDIESIINHRKNSTYKNFIRISRGYAPLIMNFETLKLKSLCASFGAMQKSSLCFGLDSTICMTPYMGNLFSPKNIQNFYDNFEFFTKLYGNPEVLIVDKHEGYESTKIAKKIAKNLSKKTQILSIYHHHVHFNALLLESKRLEGIGVIFDGSGLGADNSVWGGEFLSGNFKNFRRLMHFKPFRILGGEAHIKNTMRLTLSYALSNNITEIIQILESTLGSEFQILQSLEKTGLNSPLTSSVGRLFDIAYFILNFDILDSKTNLEYEAQSGEIIANLAFNALKGNLDSKKLQNLESKFNPYPFEIINNEINLAKTFKEMFNDMQKISLNFKLKNSNIYNFDSLDSKLQKYELKRYKIALRFIDTLAFCILESLKKIGTNHAHFGGGVFANYMLNYRLKALLDSNKIKYFFPKLPCNDYCISLGQIAFASYI